MARIVLRIEADASKVSETLANLKKEAQALAGVKIDLGINDKTATAVAKAAKAMADVEKANARVAIAEAKAAEAASKAAKAQTELQIAIQKSIQAHEKTAQAAEKTRQEEEKTAQSHDRLAQAAEKTAQAEEKTSQALQKTFQEEEKTARSGNDLAIAQEKTAQSANRLAAEQERTARATLESSDAASTASGSFSTLNVALGNIAARAFHVVLSKIRQAIHDAIAEMKNVDTQLINISKVSGKTGEDLTQIGDAAYDTASKYGVAASEYLESVYKMQKAGMGDQSENMGELAVKTMLVGDTTEEIASKFLIAANAAWKLDGNMERLGQIVDEADYINNNYATSLDKLAAGMPIVASVAENAGMSAEETMAALGTITAATQESGTKAATALRALILNIEGQVGSYITEEGEQIDVTAESVDKMKTLLEKYASAELDAAKAAGELLNPMDAIRALFKGMANDDLNDVQMFDLLSSFGGKLRTNQLTALVKNYETLYTDMMSHMEDAAGTADKEIDLMMDSWEKKTQVLKNTWTELISDILNTETIKGSIGLLTEFLDGIDQQVEKGKNPFYDSEQTNKDIESTQDKIDDLTKSIENLNKTDLSGQLKLHDLEVQLEYEKKILEIKQKQYKLEHEEEAKKLQKKLTATSADYQLYGLPYSSHDEEVVWLMQNRLAGTEFGGDIGAYQSAIKGIVGDYKEYYDNVIQVRDALGEGALTDAQKDFIYGWESWNQIASESELHAGNLSDGYREIVDSQGNTVALAKDHIETLNEENEAVTLHQDVVDDLVQKQREYMDALEAVDNASTEDERAEAIGNLTEKQTAFNDAYEEANDLDRKAFKEAVSGAEDLDSTETDAAESAQDIADNADSIDFSAANASAKSLLSTLQKAAMLQFNPLGGFGFASGTKNAPGGPTLVNELGPELISENGHAYIANGGRPGVVNLSRGAIVLTAGETKAALRSGNVGKKIHAAVNGWGLVTSGGNLAADDQRKREAAIAAAIAYNASILKKASVIDNSTASILSGDVYDSVTSSKGKGKGKGGGAAAPAGKSAEELLKEAAQNTKDTLSNIEKQAKLADNRGQYSKEEKLWAKGQAEIDKMIAQYKKAGYKETDDEILDLLNKRYDYEKKKEAASKKTIENAAKDLKEKLSNLDKQAKLANSEGNYVDEVKAYERAQEEIAKMVETYRKAGYADDSDEILELLQKNVDYGEKQVKVYKGVVKDLTNALKSDTDAQEAANKLAEKEQALAEARDALANANKQRTVRTFNAATGQWEWVADQAKVKSAQDTLTKAEKDYSEEVKDQAFKELEKLGDTVTDLNNVVLGPALSAMLLKAESSDEFQNFARALNAVYGVGSFLSSTEGSSKVLNTSDSHDTFYTFGNVTLTEEEASSMSVAELAKRLQVLKIS